jgi:hypothetical protein
MIRTTQSATELSVTSQAEGDVNSRDADVFYFALYNSLSDNSLSDRSKQHDQQLLHC